MVEFHLLAVAVDEPEKIGTFPLEDTETLVVAVFGVAFVAFASIALVLCDVVAGHVVSAFAAGGNLRVDLKIAVGDLSTNFRWGYSIQQKR